VPRMADILVVDDNPTNLKLLQLVLQAEGHEVRLASGADEAEAHVARQLPDLILMDLQLPGIDGLTLTRRFKAAARTSRIPIVAVTSYAMKGDEERARSAGCDDYVSKPIDTRTLPQVVARHLAR
jgi:CheY-like chemotaxis protein